jgi:hypothetical protein
VGFLFFSTSSKKTETPPEWFGTRQHAFFAVRKQHKNHVTPVEGRNPVEGVLPQYLSMKPCLLRKKSCLAFFCQINRFVHLRKWAKSSLQQNQNGKQLVTALQNWRREPCTYIIDLFRTRTDDIKLREE